MSIIGFVKKKYPQHHLPVVFLKKLSTDHVYQLIAPHSPLLQVSTRRAIWLSQIFNLLLISEVRCPYVQITVHIWSLLSQTSKSLFISEVYCSRRQNCCSYLKNVENFQKCYIKSSQMIDSLHKLHYGRFSEYGEKIWKKCGKIWKKCGQNFRVPILRVLPSDTLLTQFRKAPESAELTCLCAPTFLSFA